MTCAKAGVFIGGWLLISAGLAQAETFSCTCEQDSCGNRATPGRKGQVFKKLPAMSVERAFAPSRTGADKTGWVCTADETAPARYTCTCSRETCGGPPGIQTGAVGQRHMGVQPQQLTPNYGQDRIAEAATGWICQLESEQGVAAPVAVAPAVDAGYVCRCQGVLGCGSGGAPFAKRGEVREGVPAVHINSLYHSDQPGGWVCSLPPGASATMTGQTAPGQPTVDVGYVCRCQGLAGCGAGGAPFAKRGEVRAGVPAGHINTLYHSDQPGGWVCSLPLDAGAALGATSPMGQPAVDAGYVCRCQGVLGCGSGGAPFAKRGEVREGVPAIHINTLYHSDQPGGWVCSTK